MIFHPGQHVICVDAKGAGSLLSEGQEYIIERGNFTSNNFPGVFVSLVGVADHEKRENPEWGGFYVSRFRPIIKLSTETGMTILRRIADDATAPRSRKRNSPNDLRPLFHPGPRTKLREQRPSRRAPRSGVRCA